MYKGIEGKGKMKLTPKEIRKIAGQIPGQYDYMDSLQMNGWTWEFVRRNEHYIDAFSKLEKRVAQNDLIDEPNEILSELIRTAEPAGLLMGRISNAKPFDRKNFLIFRLPPFKKEKAGFNKYFGNDHHTGIVPRPDKRYVDLHGLVFMHRKVDYKIYGSFDDLLNREVIINMDPSGNAISVGPKLDRDKDFIYISVSKDARIVDLKDNLLDEIAKIIKSKKPKLRTPKWKYYLIVYDMRRRQKAQISYDDIGGILIEAYPNDDKAKLFYSARNIENWNESAMLLINGGYKRYLKQTVPPTK